MSQIRTRDWSAKETTGFGGGQRALLVAGAVEGDGQLVEADPQGMNEAVLILDLIANDGGAWTSVFYKRAVTPRHFTEVTIRTGGKDVTVRVEVVLS